jgi:hypothetical protein
VSPRVREDSVHPRLQSGACARPLNFTVRRQPVERIVRITFGVHVPSDSIGSMLTGLGGNGSVRAVDETQRVYEVKVLRVGRLPSLEKQITQWEQHGFLTYEWAAP